jgi:glycolate oxidase FAD binding subunit
VVATNISGPRRMVAGAVRDHVLGLRAVNGRGEIFRAGGRVVKNVTGYDLSKLVAGSWGTLAALVELSVKVLPRAETAATVVIEGEDAEAAVVSMGAALTSPHEVSGAAWLPGSLAASVGLAPGVPATLLRIEGPAPSVAFRAAALGGTRRLDAAATESVWRAVRDVRPFVGDRERIVWKISLPPASGAALLAALPEASAFLDWGGGLAWLALPSAPDAHAARVRAALAPVGGHATLIRADVQIRAEIPVFQPAPPAHAALSARVKDAFDPRRVLNPGRMYADV